MARSSTTLAEGNVLAIKHGATPGSIVTPQMEAGVAAIAEDLASSLPYLGPGDGLLIERAARLVLHLRRMDEYYDRLGGSLIDRQGQPRRSWPLYTNLNHQLRATLAQLGVGPSVRAAMAGQLAAGGLAGQLAAHRRGGGT